MKRFVVCGFLIFLSAAMLSAATVKPVAVSPGASDRLHRFNDSCPTFSWAGVDGAVTYTLAVYELDDNGRPGPEVIRRALPAGAFSWTAPEGSCLIRGMTFGWSVGATSKDGVTTWSEPALFQVAAGPSPTEIERALAVVEAYLRDESPSTVAPGMARNKDSGESERERAESRRVPQPAAPAIDVSVDGGVEAGIFVGDGSGLTSLSPSSLSSAVGVTKGGTGATSASGARSNLGAASAAELSSHAGSASAHHVQTIDTLSSLVCLDSEVAKWNEGQSKWECADDLLHEPASLFGRFGGSGIWGARTVAGGTQNLGGGVRRQYTSLTVAAGAELVADDGFAFIAVQGRCTIAGTISANGGTSPNFAGPGCANGQRANGVGLGWSASSIGIKVASCVTGAGGGGGGTNDFDGCRGGGGGGLGGFGDGNGSPGTAGGPASDVDRKVVSGGADGDGDGGTVTDNFARLLYYPGGTGASGGADAGSFKGGRGEGGGVIYLECGELEFTGTMTARGGDGAAGTGSSAGGGGGGGGGVVLVRTRSIVASTGSVDVSGGSGGSGVGVGTAGGDGGSGYWDIVILP